MKVLRVMAPMPEVAPTKTATRREGRLVQIRELECWMCERETIVQSCECLWNYCSTGCWQNLSYTGKF